MIQRMLTIASGNLASVGYDVGEKQLAVTFRDVPEYTYVYSNIGAEVFAELINADSVGSYFAKSIKVRNGKTSPFMKSLTTDFVKSLK